MDLDLSTCLIWYLLFLSLHLRKKELKLTLSYRYLFYYCYLSLRICVSNPCTTYWVEFCPFVYICLTGSGVGFFMHTIYWQVVSGFFFCLIHKIPQTVCLGIDSTIIFWTGRDLCKMQLPSEIVGPSKICFQWSKSFQTCLRKPLGWAISFSSITKNINWCALSILLLWVKFHIASQSLDN